jgi:hypothetical protein
MKKTFLLLLVLFGARSLVRAQTFALSSPTTAIGAGRPSRAITIQQTGSTLYNTTFALSDGGAGGAFYPTAPVIVESTDAAAYFIYIPAPGATGAITLSATASVGMTGTETLTLPIENNASAYASDNFSYTSGTAVQGSNPQTTSAVVPATLALPLTAEQRAAYQNLYNQFETAIENTTDVNILESLNASQLAVETVLSQDAQEGLANNTANTMVCFNLSSPSTVTWLAINVKVQAN